MARNFETFADHVRVRFAEMARESLFVVEVDKEEIWQTYLEAFPEGTNPIFRTRTEHDCSCCRHFIRDIGAVVAIENGAVTTVWDLNGLPHPYQAVADAMAAYVKARPVVDVFLTGEATHGVLATLGVINGATIRFSHFWVEVPRRMVNRDHATRRGHVRTSVAMLLRAVSELKSEAVSTVVGLIEQNALYRGAEFKGAVTEFQRLQARMAGLSEAERGVIAWTLAESPAARFRNTVIGTLVEDLSDGKDIEAAVRAYETKVAPQNYKRPTALITKGMVEAAMKTIGDLGIEHALERRHARLSDVSVSDVLFVDNSVQAEMKGGIKGLLMQDVKAPKIDPKKAEEIGIDAFVANVLPKATSLRVVLDNGALGSFVSLTAPVHDDAPPIFRWGNGLAWSYDGNVTDSIKERVKRAGGRVENVAMRVSLAWSNTDDLDIHVFEPSGNRIYYGNKSGKLDVDMNVMSPVRDPVENVRWIGRPSAGRYHVVVNQYRRRESIDVGFEIEIEAAGKIETLRWEKALSQGQNVPVCEIVVDRSGLSVEPAPGIVGGSSPREKWGVKTMEPVKVNAVVLSPNHWDEKAAGNKHWFFLLDGCRNPDPVRGIYNEFLKPDLEEHRKVFEVLGDRTKCQVSDQQLSGVGFSSTRGDRVTVIATGPALNKTYTVVFGKDAR
jgi:hypothetical protein